ncbi:zinc finger protein 569-like [Drosophila albomicans]|uniref:Zinc finger protein 569-like n=1 Tax=Drosophila albomicans TaxID=7291 RepID=A0A6P8XNI1_DROAB|nr:zinc finger protein 569-like [Drosophila albomicans]
MCLSLVCDKPYKCDQCGRSYAAFDHLRRHKLTQTGERPYAVRQHKISHSGEKPFKCDKCMKAFPTKKGLSIHMRIHNKEAPVTATIISSVGGGGTTNSSAQSQSQDQCNICERFYLTTSSLAAHMRTHAQHSPNRNCRRRSNSNRNG